MKQVQQIQELEAQVNHLEGVIGDQRVEMTLLLRKQNDMSYQCSKGEEFLDKISVIKNESMKSIVSPFLQSLVQQVCISNIL